MGDKLAIALLFSPAPRDMKKVLFPCVFFSFINGMNKYILSGFMNIGAGILSLQNQLDCRQVTHTICNIGWHGNIVYNLG